MFHFIDQNINNNISCQSSTGKFVLWLKVKTCFKSILPELPVIMNNSKDISKQIQWEKKFNSKII